MYVTATGVSYTNTLNYNANGGAGEPNSDSKTVNYPLTKLNHNVSTNGPSTAPVETGYDYTFAGWYDDAKTGTKISGTVAVGSDCATTNQSKTLYAH
ncbi:MAG: InlB B-repeat-containing protein [Clostridia bacterium]|nr:InlB B-repeat-containing protein [Clostridia bacterium]